MAFPLHHLSEILNGDGIASITQDNHRSHEKPKRRHVRISKSSSFSSSCVSPPRSMHSSNEHLEYPPSIKVGVDDEFDLPVSFQQPQSLHSLMRPCRWNSCPTMSASSTMVKGGVPKRINGDQAPKICRRRSQHNEIASAPNE
uniref:Uncharacterized protein n=1 Tax=Entomoneis paludosa TaxID=265537 RepID=A0A7S2V6S4_9STRA|mmetsp:Transcript_10095/g.20841  ORF Transcript_10095/g.20841 Transcript_10095/m.20841 type:complete len:143 (+) Transcript_10095:122-550(+)